MAKNSGFSIDRRSFKELNDNLMRLEKLSQQKAVLRKALIKSAQPVAQSAAGAAPVGEGTLRDSMTVSTKLNKSQAKQHKKAGRSAVEAFIGPSGAGSVHGGLVEFGDEGMPPRPYLRPAWEAGKEQLLADLANEMAKEIDKAVKRQTKRNAKKGL
ncbi:HK97-gp10 family putative phage morphogenesis protein [Cereibacter changlensis]|uniref:HK97-gp10 family putative phage morphogenesis protein n=1 Tax=Cereibacter changlensis TaxID=402884 RepID=UPI00403447A9